MASPPVVDEEYREEIEKARRDLRALIYNEDCAPTMVRLAWHDAWTFDVKKKIGGPNGSIRNKDELKHAANAGLSVAVDLCEDVKANYPGITYADLYQLAGVVAIEMIGGPTIEFVPGRKDSLVSPREGNLPDATKQGNELLRQLREIFYRLGLSEGEIVALSVAHTLVGTEPLRFDNSYFWKLRDEEEFLPTSNPLLEDPFRCYCELYAEDGLAFFRDIAISHKKLSELVCFAPTASKTDSNGFLVHSGFEVFVTAALVILSYAFLSFKKKRNVKNNYV